MPARDPAHWLYRFTPREWIQAALAESARAEKAFETGERKGGLACCRRAGGMALNAALALADTPDARYGRTYFDHLVTLAGDASAPTEVRDAARLLVETPLPGGEIVSLRTPGSSERFMEAVKTVMAHAYAAVVKAEPSPRD